MRLAQSVLPKKPEAGYGGGAFCSVREGLIRTRQRTAGTMLVVSDPSGCALSAAAGLPRTVCVVLAEEDALPLFSMDSVGAVFAAGRREVLLAARAYCALNRTPCVLAPSSATLDGVFERSDVLIGGERGAFPLAEGELVLDRAYLLPSVFDAYGRLLLSKLALFEERAMEMMGERGECGHLQEMFEAVSVLDGEPTVEQVIAANERLRRAEAAGAPVGEGRVLSALYREKSAPIRAFCELYALYSAFFRRGKARRYVVPDYRERARRAGTAPSSPPDQRLYARRALTLEKRRSDLVREIERAGRDRAKYLAVAGKFSGRRYVPSGDLSVLKTLPEHCPKGLSALIRDFGLLEEC